MRVKKFNEHFEKLSSSIKQKLKTKAEMQYFEKKDLQELLCSLDWQRKGYYTRLEVIDLVSKWSKKQRSNDVDEMKASIERLFPVEKISYTMIIAECFKNINENHQKKHNLQQCSITVETVFQESLKAILQVQSLTQIILAHIQDCIPSQHDNLTLKEIQQYAINQRLHLEASCEDILMEINYVKNCSYLVYSKYPNQKQHQCSQQENSRVQKVQQIEEVLARMQSRVTYFGKEWLI